MRWSFALFGLAALVALPFALLAFYLAIGGEDMRTQLTQAAAGGGTIAALLALAGRLCLIAAVKIGLGGRFGGGGAGGAVDRVDYCGLTPAALMILSHFTISPRR
jgi:hypothetical protein